MNNDKVLQLLKAHLGLELETIEFYQSYVKQVRDPAARGILLQLINESIGHADGFRRILYKQTLGIDYGRQGVSTISLSGLLEAGMKEERGMRLAYEDALLRLPDGEYKTFLAGVIEDERRHERMLKQVYDKLNAD